MCLWYRTVPYGTVHYGLKKSDRQYGTYAYVLTMWVKKGGYSTYVRWFHDPRISVATSYVYDTSNGQYWHIQIRECNLHVWRKERIFFSSVLFQFQYLPYSDNFVQDSFRILNFAKTKSIFFRSVWVQKIFSDFSEKYFFRNFPH